MHIIHTKYIVAEYLLNIINFRKFLAHFRGAWRKKENFSLQRMSTPRTETEASPAVVSIAGALCECSRIKNFGNAL